MTVQIYEGDSLAVLRTLESESVQLVVTSPPYFGLRDYGVDGQIGLESTPAAFLDALFAVFDEVKRVLRKDGLAFVNLGDSYSGSGKGPTGANGIGDQEQRQGFTDKRTKILSGRMRLRVDLTPGERAYVLSELAKARSISDATQEGRE